MNDSARLPHSLRPVGASQPLAAGAAAAESCCGSAGGRPPLPESPELQSVLTCPQCGHVSLETMPTDACVYFHECAGCHALLKPRAGDCCVFCSYGSVPCPPIQAGRTCC